MAPPRTAREILTDRALLRYAVAHHPTCSEFAADVVVAGLRRHRVPLCTGCVVFWPLLLLGVPGLLAAALHLGLAWWAFLAVGPILGSAQLLSYLQRTPTRRAKLAVKSAFGLGAAAFITGLILAPWPGIVRIGVGLAAAALAAVLHTRRFRNITAVCDACPWRRDWQYCPGFAPLNDHVPGSEPTGWTGDDARLPRAWPWRPRATERETSPAKGRRALAVAPMEPDSP